MITVLVAGIIMMLYKVTIDCKDFFLFVFFSSMMSLNKMCALATVLMPVLSESCSAPASQAGVALYLNLRCSMLITVHHSMSQPVTHCVPPVVFLLLFFLSLFFFFFFLMDHDVCVTRCLYVHLSKENQKSLFLML